ncbi:PH domain-containing protein [Microbacterium sp.]|uniref:PH domain-containing protein n=1 Tax=Microbacterium sp. TaxID=51671 RepID=UPI0039E70EE4
MSDAIRPVAARTFRAATGLASFVLCALVALFLLGDAVVRGGWGQTFLLAPWVLLALWVLYEFTWASCVRIDAQGAVVQNLLRRTTFGWAQVRDIDLRWQLVFTLADGKDLTCFGGPARSRPVRRSREDEEAKAPAGIRELTEIRDRWQAAPAAADAAIRRSWDVPALIALGVIAVWAVAAIAIANS